MPQRPGREVHRIAPTQAAIGVVASNWAAPAVTTCAPGSTPPVTATSPSPSHADTWIGCATARCVFGSSTHTDGAPLDETTADAGSRATIVPLSRPNRTAAV